MSETIDEKDQTNRKMKKKKQEARQTSSNSLVYEDDVGELPAKKWLHTSII